MYKSVTYAANPTRIPINALPTIFYTHSFVGRNPGQDKMNYLFILSVYSSMFSEVFI